MKIICSQSQLKNGIRTVLSAVPSRPTHPVLGNILLKSSSNILELTGFDLSLGIRTSLDCQSYKDGSITLPAKTFSDIITLLPEGEVTLESDDNEDDGNRSVIITSSTGKFEIQGMSAEEFPLLTDVEEGVNPTVNIRTFLKGVRSTLFSASTDETKQVLTGINIKYENNQFIFASTDGHRLSVWKSDLDEDSDDSQDSFSVTVLSSHLKELDRILASEDDDAIMSVRFNDSSISFSNNYHLLVGRILAGAYPSYPQLIPTQFSGKFTCDRKRLISAIDRVSVLCDQKNNTLRLEVNPDDQQLRVLTAVREVGSGQEYLSAQISNDTTITIGFNTKYLLEGLKNFSTTEVTFNFNSEKQPVVITPLGGEDTLYLIMPVQIRE